MYIFRSKVQKSLVYSTHAHARLLMMTVSMRFSWQWDQKRKKITKKSVNLEEMPCEEQISSIDKKFSVQANDEMCLVSFYPFNDHALTLSNNSYFRYDFGSFATFFFISCIEQTLNSNVALFSSSLLIHSLDFWINRFFFSNTKFLFFFLLV